MLFLYLFTDYLFSLSGSDGAQDRPHRFKGIRDCCSLQGGGEEEEEANCRRCLVLAEALEEGATGKGGDRPGKG